MSESENPDDIVIPAGKATLFKSMIPYVIKVLVTAIIFVGAVSFLLPNAHEISAKVKNELRKDENRIRLKGLFTTNPAVHMKVSYLKEQAGDIKGAVMEIELAIGLLELHSADKAVISRYQARLDELRKKMPAQG